ncbi:mercuric transporter MerT family protein [Inmirania thermothiophila]|uniref:Mercuric transport protein MerT n=1 Tax=Inmirania thermothiophila TaxID=1750597 RepID=A0A3N1Y0I1_9GAMM|nr:mercuric transporter MerT family protein [Inmirania thermothiophila]ROR32343.1 mercuric ion transport protein [Inmirania thermothiophila]
MAATNEGLEARPQAAAGDRGARVAAAGSVLGAVAASSCCIVPLVLFSLGATGAWIGNLTALAPYQPYFVAATVLFLGLGFWRVYRRPACAGGGCAPARRSPWVVGALWAATVLTAAALAFPYVAPLWLEG